MKNSPGAICWSKQGLVAYSFDTHSHRTTNGNLFLTHMECLDGKDWHLASPNVLRIAGGMLETPNLMHRSSKKIPNIKLLEFSSSGWDLFVADEAGTVSILVSGLKRVEKDLNPAPASNLGLANGINPVEFTRTSFNSCVLFYSDFNENPDQHLIKNKEGNQVVSMKWLKSDKVQVNTCPAKKMQQTAETPLLNGSASKHGAAFEDSNGQYYHYEIEQNKPFGATHPLSSKQACIYVRKNGTVCLVYQEDHGVEYKKSVTQLESLSEDDTISKADIGFAKDGSLIVVAHLTGEHQIRIYQVTIDWTFLKAASKIIAEQPHYRVPDEQRTPPVLTAKKLFVKTLDPKAQGMHLESIFMLSPSDAAHNIEFLIQLGKIRKLSSDECQTKLLRFTMEEQRIGQTIPKSFKNMASKRGIDITTVAGTAFKLDLIQDFQFNDIILSTQLFSTNRHIAFISASGLIEVLNRDTFSPVINPYTKTQSLNKDHILPPVINSLLEAGFEFPQITNQFDACYISPNMCAYVYLPSNSNNLHLACMNTDNVDTSFYDGSKKGLLFSTSATVAFCHMNAYYQGIFTDDIIATIRNNIEKASIKSSQSYAYRLSIAVLQESHRSLNLNLDIPTDQSEAMSRGQPLQRLLSLQLSLGSLKNWRRNRSGKIAFALINLRFVITTIVYVINTVYQNIQRFSKKGIPDLSENLVAREKCILSSIGLIRWCLDYIILISQELFELQNAFKFNDTEKIEMMIKESIAVPMIIGKVPRGFLITAISSIKRLFSFLQKLLEKTNSEMVGSATPDSPLSTFDKLQESFLQSDSSVLFKTPNSKFNKAYLSQSTLETYLVLGSIVKEMPVSLMAFSKFLTETDAPLRANKLDQLASLALEQQIVCQGYIKPTLSESLRKVCDVFDKVVLQVPGTSISKLFFQDISWIGIDDTSDNDDSNDDFKTHKSSRSESSNDSIKMDGIISPVTDVKRAKEQFSSIINSQIFDGLLLDSLRKVMKSPDQFVSNDSERAHSMSFDDIGLLKIKKCTRCGSISSLEDDIIMITSNFSFINSPVFQHYQRQCICGGSWTDV